ncbi:hypothetical protein DICPUDRAFT_89564 [Dictyostelium purpureum]|uniref:CWH43-like N-terminal domain-containing protein n=1 Tax=Dictyostelium purpureum TaxID=5786 RepID=F0ZWN2_DICPU|nr:uncharacterized protein DICPUDRAFT_89564 [Dictyostelium purpureum]EGC31660.1 hypothetical protein DICPUDRAFT_89564 [Dictyostelium purpureum]|eukprot:XP_003291826.1 hypothetical protein DICPUDRAFT_89564 [Dictyostelium purpureum]
MTSMIRPSFLIYTVATIVPITLITTYTIPEKLHHDKQIIPFISSSINNAPEGDYFNKFHIIGIVSAFSMNGVASFQYKNAMDPHLIFAALFFLCGFTYIVTQTILDKKTSNIPSKIFIIRVVLCCVCSLFFIYVTLQFFKGPLLQNISALFEIISASCIFIYLVTYLYEFSKMTLNIDFSLNNYSQKQNNRSLFDD